MEARCRVPRDSRGVSRGGTIGRSPMARVVQPAEWARHKAVWIGFPSHAELWRDDLMPDREEVIAFARAVHAVGQSETVLLVAADDEAAAAARQAAPFSEVVVEPLGQIWLSETAPILFWSGTGGVFHSQGRGRK